MTSAWCFRLLGPVTASHGGRPVNLGGPTARALLATLLLRGSTISSTDDLIECVWGGPGEATRDSVYQYLRSLRTALAVAPGASVTSQRPGYRLIVDDESVDWRRFQRLVTQGRRALAGNDESAVDLLSAGLELWTGEPLDGIGGRLAAERQAMVEQRLAAEEELAGLELARGRPVRVIELLSTDAARAPGRERAAALLIQALVATGQRDRAGEVFQRARSFLAEQLGLDPSAELTRAHEAVWNGPPPEHPQPVRVDRRYEPPTWSPATDRHFHGRTGELRQVSGALLEPGGTRVCTIHGMAGVGKTAMAMRAADEVAREFPDGVFVVEFSANAQVRMSTRTEDALDQLLRRLGVPAQAIPSDVQERGELYQRVVRERRILFVFDDVPESRRIQPLLPVSTGCAVIVTSRRRLAALDDATAVPLDVLPLTHGIALFRSVAGSARLATEPDVDERLPEIVERCGRLPLAIRIAAARYRVSPAYSLAELQAQLVDAHSVLAALDDGERSVAASVESSVTALPATVRSALAALARHPGPDLEPGAAAAVLGGGTAQATWHLDQLADRHLVTHYRPGRYRFHDLIAAYARERIPTPADADRTVVRALADFYLLAADRADRLITPQRFRVPLVVTEAAVPSFDRYEAALSWFDAESPNLVEVCWASGEHGLDEHCWQLAFTLRGYYYLTKPWSAWLRTHEAALAAARRLQDPIAEAHTVNNLGLAHLERGMLDVAREHYRRAEALFDGAGDEHGVQTARANLAWLSYSEGRYADFLNEIAPALDFYRRTGAERNAAITLRGMSLAEAATGRTAAALTHLREALDVFTSLGLRLDAVMSLNGLGDAYVQAGDDTAAWDAYERAALDARRCGSEFERARAHHGLGLVALGRGDHPTARTHLQAALDAYGDLDAPQADAVRQLLAS